MVCTIYHAHRSLDINQVNNPRTSGGNESLSGIGCYTTLNCSALSNVCVYHNTKLSEHVFIVVYSGKERA